MASMSDILKREVALQWLHEGLLQMLNPWEGRAAASIHHLFSLPCFAGVPGQIWRQSAGNDQLSHGKMPLPLVFLGADGNVFLKALIDGVWLT